MKHLKFIIHSAIFGAVFAGFLYLVWAFICWDMWPEDRYGVESLMSFLRLMFLFGFSLRVAAGYCDEMEKKKKEANDDR